MPPSGVNFTFTLRGSHIYCFAGRFIEAFVLWSNIIGGMLFRNKEVIATSLCLPTLKLQAVELLGVFDRKSVRGNNLGWYSGGDTSESRPGHRLSSLTFFVVLPLILSRYMPVL